jgi:gamma-glutamyltranspeptidase/glutathione hydrolase
MRRRLGLDVVLWLSLVLVARDGRATGMVAAAHPLAAEAGAAVLAEGGSAADAAVAVQMLLTVVEPQSSGLGGGTVVMHWSQADGKLRAYDGLALAPAGVGPALTTDRDGREWAVDAVRTGGRSVGIPGTLAVLAAMHGAHGKLPWPRLFDRAIAAADRGFPMPPYLHRALQQARGLADHVDVRDVYFQPDGAPKAVGVTIVHSTLAETLRRVAAEGPKALTVGAIAAATVAATRRSAVAGVMTAEDLASYRAVERAPICAPFLVYRVCTFPPPAFGGVAVLQQLGLLERLGIAAVAPRSVEAAHLVIEVSRLAYADRMRFIGDPDFADVPIVGLLDSAYLDGRAQLIHLDRALRRVGPGEPQRRASLHGDSEPWAMAATSHVAIVDGQGDAVSMTTTINLNFGARLMPAGFFLNNAMTNFAREPERNGLPVPNRMQPGKRPYTSMAPSMAFDADGRLALIVGAAGGARIVDFVTQAVVATLAWGLPPAEALAMGHSGFQNGRTEIERGTPIAELKSSLEALGHAVEAVDMSSGAQVIRVTPRGPVGAADPRRDGAVAVVP